MRSKVTAFIGMVLLALGTLCGPVLWIMGFACAYTAWLPGIGDAARLELLYAAFVFGCWGLWGLTSGLARLPRVLLGAGSLLNLITGFLIFVSGEPHSKAIGALFLAYSLGLLIACRRPYVHYVN